MGEEVNPCPGGPFTCDPAETDGEDNQCKLGGTGTCPATGCNCVANTQGTCKCRVG